MRPVVYCSKNLTALLFFEVKGISEDELDLDVLSEFDKLWDKFDMDAFDSLREGLDLGLGFCCCGGEEFSFAVLIREPSKDEEVRNGLEFWIPEDVFELILDVVAAINVEGEKVFDIGVFFDFAVDK